MRRMNTVRAYAHSADDGQRRVLIAWDRLVTTDGQSVELAAYGTDRVGRSGLPGKVRTHFLKRFGSAALISIIGAAPAVAASQVEDENAADAVQDVGDGLTESLGIRLRQTLQCVGMHARPAPEAFDIRIRKRLLHGDRRHHPRHLGPARG
jgi:type IV secretory pathway VirB10-like protein